VIPCPATPKDLGGFLLVDVASGAMKQAAIAKDRIYFEPTWLPDMTGLLVFRRHGGNWISA